jgi:hypothetical protein
VLQADLRDDGNERDEHVCRVKTAAEPRLDHGEADSRGAEGLEGGGRGHLEEGRLAQVAGKGGGGGLDAIQRGLQAGVGDGLPAEDDAFMEGSEMRGGEAACPEAGGVERGGHERGHGALPVRAGHMHGDEGAFGISKRVQEGLDALQSRTHAESPAFKQLFESLLQHGAER